MEQIERDYQERMSHIHELFRLAETNKSPNPLQVRFIEKIAEKLHLNDFDLQMARTSEIEFTPPKEENKRIPQFHRYLLILARNKKINEQEAKNCLKVGLRMGLYLEAVEQIIERMKRTPINKIPPKQILDTFKTHYN